MKGIGERIILFTDLYFHLYSSETSGEGKKIPDDYRWFLFNLMDKIVETFAGVGQLLKTSEETGMAFLRTPLYILLRGNLSDVIIAFWLLDSLDRNKADDDQSTTSKRVNDLMSDHINFHVSYLRKMCSLELLSPDEKKEEINIINSHFKHILNEEIGMDLVIKSQVKGPSLTSMLDKSTKTNRFLLEAYTAYFLFSKIEHSGAFTKKILEKTHQEKNPADQYIKSSIHSIEAIIKVLVPAFFKNEVYTQRIASFEIYE